MSVRLPRLELLFRVGPASDTLTARYDIGGAGDSGNQTVTLTRGLYTLTALLAHIETQVEAATSGPWTVAMTSGRVVLTTDATSSVTWNHLALRDWLGFAANLSAAASYTASAAPHNYFLASLPWDDAAELCHVWSTRRWGPSAGPGGGATLLGSHRVWQTVAYVQGQTELAQFRAVLQRLLRGMPARWYRSTEDATAWSTANWDGYVDVVLSPDYRGQVEQFVAADLQHVMSVPLRFLEWSP